MSDQNHEAALQSLIEIFGSRIHVDAVNNVLLSYGGDVSQAIERLLLLNPEGNESQSEMESATSYMASSNRLNSREEPEQGTNTQPMLSYAGASQKGAIPKNTARDSQPPTCGNKLTDLNRQLKRIVEHHVGGYCTLVVMRGVPGSGKTTLARQVVDFTVGRSPEHYRSHICSADDFFLHNGLYLYDISRLSEAHVWVKKKIFTKLSEGMSPIIVDNTNTQLWEMETCIRDAVQLGYYIEVLEPNTPWAKKASQLANKNTHNVPYNKILRMLHKYEDHHSTEYIMSRFHLSYQPHFVPPIMRKIPPLPQNVNFTSQARSESDVNDMNVGDNQFTKLSSALNVVGEKSDPQHTDVLNLWEKAPAWDDERDSITQTSSDVEPKPQREPRLRDHSRGQSSTDSLSISHEIEAGSLLSQWQQISSSLPAWDHDVVSNTEESKPTISVKHSSGTAVESGDHDKTNSLYTVLTASPRDINFSYTPPNIIKIPHTIMLDKSSMTTDDFDVHQAVRRCKNVKKHFIVLRKMFKGISEEVLKDIFDKCGGDVNWTTEVLLDGGVPLSAHMSGDVEGTQSDDDDPTPNEICDCISEYEIAPRVSTPPPVSVVVTPLELHSARKKKEKVMSETSVKLIRQLEQSVDISDYHYSSHCLKIKKSRHGKLVTTDLPVATTPLTALQPSIDPEFTSFNLIQRNTAEDLNDTVDVMLGTELIRQAVKVIEKTTEDVVYPGHIVPVVNMPKSFLNHIYAMWMESLSHQIDMHHIEKEVLLKEDEELARKLAMEEDGSGLEEESFCLLEAAEAGASSGQPALGLKEIIDQEVALSLAARKANEWRNVMPIDMAAHLTRDKLFKLFSHIKQDILSEVLLAHNNNFHNTVEALLISTGQMEILKENNGVNKFIHEKEAQMQQAALEKARQQEREDEWPVLGGEKAKEALIESVNEYRQKAEEHLKNRNMNQQKAREYLSRGMPEAALHHTQLASFHHGKMELNNSLAATAIVQVHASNKSNTTLDLHYLRVGEALETLDVFLDYHIQALRASRGQRHNSLFLVTGRGLHSPNGPRIKPAVKRRLIQRGFRALELNPGLLTVCVTDTHLLTHQMV